jgi:hypothetical protein
MGASANSASLQICLQSLAVSLRQAVVHTNQRLPHSHGIAFLHQDLAHNSRLGRLHDLQKTLRHQLSLCYRNNVEAPDTHPNEHRS